MSTKAPSSDPSPSTITVLVPAQLPPCKHRLTQQSPIASGGSCYIYPVTLCSQAAASTPLIAKVAKTPLHSVALIKEFEMTRHLGLRSLSCELIPSRSVRGLSKGKMVIIMNHLEGQTLYNKYIAHPVNDFPLVPKVRRLASHEKITSIALSTLRQLHSVHAQGVIHADVTPSNILQGRATQLIDFGLARFTDPRKNLPISFEGEVYEIADTIVTREYRPPEAWLEQADKYGPQVDIWSLGCTLYELYMGDPLFTFRQSSDDHNRVVVLYKMVQELGQF